MDNNEHKRETKKRSRVLTAVTKQAIQCRTDLDIAKERRKTGSDTRHGEASLAGQLMEDDEHDARDTCRFVGCLAVDPITTILSELTSQTMFLTPSLS